MAGNGVLKPNKPSMSEPLVAPASANGANISPEGVAGVPKRRASQNGVVVFALVVFVLAFLVVLGVWYAVAGRLTVVTIAVAAVAGWLAESSVHMVLEWEKAVVLRFGKFNRVAGPGLVLTWPIIEFYTLRVDQRIASTYFGAEETLTSDLVPVNVDAVIFWMVWSAKDACTEVEDYAQAVSWMAQTAMRKAIGRNIVVELATRRDQLDEELKDALEEKLNAWGITVIDVEIRDIVIPKELQQAMAAEAVADRKKNARMVLAEAEADISAMLNDAGGNYQGNPEAMKLRQMHLAYESVEESGGTLVLPSSFAEGFVEDSAGVPAAGVSKGTGRSNEKGDL